MSVKQLIEIDVSYEGWQKRLSVATVTAYVAGILSDAGIVVNRINVRQKKNG